MPVEDQDKSEYFITYLCMSCGSEACLLETAEPMCNFCVDSKLMIINEEKATIEVYDKTIIKVNDKLIKLLKEKLLNKDFDDEYDSEEKIFKELIKRQGLSNLIKSGETITNEKMNKYTFNN